MASNHTNDRIDRVEEKLDDLIRDLPKLIATAVHNYAGKGNEASWVRQSVGLTIAVITLIGFIWTMVVGIVTPINQNMKFIKDDLAVYKSSNYDQIKEYRILSDQTHNISQERVDDRFEKLESWQQWWHKNVPAQDSKQTTEVAYLQQQIEDLKGSFCTRSVDSFTVAEGKMMQKQIDRLEDRLTFVTKMLTGVKEE